MEDQKEVVADLEKQLTNTPLQAVAPRAGDTGLAVSFYQELVSLRTQKEVLAASLEKLKTVRAGVETKLQSLPEKGMQYAHIKSRQQSLESAQSLLASRQREAQIYEDNPPGYYRFFDAKPDEVEVTSRAKKTILVAVAGGVLGVMFSLGLICLVESLDDRIKTPADARRATRLPLLASLPPLATLDATEQDSWAFRTWMALQSRLSDGARQAIVCGFAASTAGEGVSTWIDLLARAASSREAAVVAITNGAAGAGPAMRLEDALRAPSQLPARPGSVTWLRLEPDWRWDAPRRALWQDACREWQHRPGMVILLELKGIDLPESLLLAESLPQIIWVMGVGIARSRMHDQPASRYLAQRPLPFCGRGLESRAEALSLDESRPMNLRQITAGLAATLLLAAAAPGATTNDAATPPYTGPAPLVYAGANAKVKAAWQQHLTLGSGDVVNLGFYGRPELARTDVTIEPDGRLSYLQAQGVMAAGLTIDELRQALATELGKYYKKARVTVTPAAFHSKKFFVLGKVVNKGAYLLDRPRTLLEGVAMAAGLENGLFE